MEKQDRIYIDKARQESIRGIKGNGYLEFDNQKDVFMYAMTMGMDCYSGGELTGTKDGFFNDRDLNEADKALMYALIRPELDNLEDITDRDLVFRKAEGMADKGFSIILDEMKDTNVEVFMLQMLNKTNELYEAAKKDNLFDV